MARHVDGCSSCNAEAGMPWQTRQRDPRVGGNAEGILPKRGQQREGGDAESKNALAGRSVGNLAELGLGETWRVDAEAAGY